MFSFHEPVLFFFVFFVCVCFFFWLHLQHTGLFLWGWMLFFCAERECKVGVYIELLFPLIM